MNLEENLERVRKRIQGACERGNRDPSDVSLLAVSKGHTLNDIQSVTELGLHRFGENKIQEAKLKIPAGPRHAEWHFIGHLQTNKSRDAVRLFHMIHGVDSLRLAEALQETCEKQARNARVLLEINISGEASKHGFCPKEALDQLEYLNTLQRLEIHGFMTMAPWTPEVEKTRPIFRQLHLLRQQCEDAMGVPFPVLSMGMSHDFEVAIEEGATIVRVGTSLFGKRHYSKKKLSK
ncbi:MAG: YggS family pyridoxal phosphate-dependent enzyme [Verrucomicrobiota bacterium]|nr:YggS family pyridoxal phosphate-dependent enzyme [Verrucomicrobiota bacterium]